MTLQPDLADLAPGDEAEFHVAMANDGSDDVQVELELQGLDADLWTLANPIPVIPAGQVGRTTIRVRLPEDATPGERRISVSVRDAAGTVGASAAAALRVGSNDVIAIETDPASVAGKKGAKLDTIVRNRGDETLRLRVTGRSDGASVTVRPAEFDLPPGKGARLKARVERNQRSWFKERRHGLVLDVRGGTVPATTSAIFVQKPIVPPVLLRSLAVLVALAVWASATFVLFSRMSATEEVAAPAAPTDTLDPNAPPPTVLLAGDVPVEDDGTVAPPLVIAGTVEGPRDLAGTAVTIERVSLGDEGTTDGGTGKVAPLTPVAVTSGTVLDKITATTDEKGRFRVASGLAMGAFYRVTAQRAGFDLRSQVVSITEETPEIELALSLVPGRGVMTGRVVDTAGNPVGGATIAATQGSVTYRTTTASTGDAFGTWSLEGLATPSTYLITIAAVGFASQQLTVEVGGGATVGGVDAELTRDRGTIRGRITYRDAGVGAVTVALEGEVSRTTTTLTIGDLKGSFDFPNLPYGTYLLTFSAPGWLTSSREVTVTSGDVPVDVKDLLPSTAIVQGVVAQQVVDGGCDYPDPTSAGAAEIGAGSCGGVGVSVIGENGVWSTTTATGDGSFRISGVPAGEYTVRFERYGYLPEFYKVAVGPGDVVTLPDDATYDVEMAAYVGPRNRVLEPLSTESVQLRLVPTTALDAGRVTGIVRDAFDVDTDFDASFPDWSGGCRDERVDVVVLGQPDVVCVLSAGGGFELLGVAAGAADLVVNAPGFGTYTSTIQVAPTGETQAGLIPLTPLASLILNVTGTGDVPVEDAVVFVAPTDPAVPVFRGEADVRECTVARADVNDLWREVSTVPDGYQSRSGLCGDADSAGDVSFARGLGTGSFEVILPVNGADPSDPAELAGTVPMDHRQLSRSIEVQVGESARLDLRLRRYASIVGTIQVPNPTGTGYTNLTALDGLAAFPAMGLEDPADPNSDPEGIEFCEIYEQGDTIPNGSAVGDCRPFAPSYVTPRVSFGSAAGLAPGQFRINRIPPNEGTLLREYRIRIFTDDGDFERSPEGAGGVEGLAFGEERTLSAVASPGPTDVEIAVVWNDGTGLVPVPDALVQVSGTAGFRTLDTPPFREELILTCPGPDCETGGSSDDGFPYVILPADRDTDAEGRVLADLGSSGDLSISGVFRTGTLTVYSVAPGFEAVTTSVALRSAEVGDGYQLEMLPAAKEVSGTVTFSPSFAVDAASDALIAAMTATLTPVRGGTSVTSQLAPDGLGGATYGFPSVRPGSYTLRISGSGVFTASSTVVISPSTASSVTISPVAVNRTVTLDVTVEECAPGDTCPTDRVTPVPGATLALQSSVDGGSNWSVVGTSVSCADTNAATCAGLGVATFTDLVASTSTIYRIVVPVSPKAGYRQVAGSLVVPVGSLTADVTTASVTVEQFGSVTGVVRGKVDSGDADSAAARLAGVVVQLHNAQNAVVASATTDGSGTFTFPASARVTDGTYSVVVPQSGVVAAASYQAQVNAPSVTVAGPDVIDLGATAIVLTASRVTVSGTVFDPSTDPDLLLPNVRVSIVGGTACPATVDPSVSSTDCVWTDQAGAFSMTMIPRSSTLRFQEFAEVSPGVWAATDRPTLERGIAPSIGQGITGLQIEKRPALGGLTGTIRVRNFPGAAETGIVGATVTATLTTDPSVSSSVTTTANGSFAISDLLTGTYDLTVSALGYVGESYAGVIVVANSSATVPVITMNADTRPVRVKVVSGGSPLEGIALRADPPSGSTGVSPVTGTTDASGLVDLDLVPGGWSVATTNGSAGTLTVGGNVTVDHIDATGIPLTVTFDSAGALQDTSATPLISFVAVSGSVQGESYTGVDEGALDGVSVTVDGGSASGLTTGGTWTLFAPATSVARTITFDVEKIGYVAGSTTASVANVAATASPVTLRALPGTDVTFRLTSSAGGAVVGATVVLVQGASSLTAPTVTDSAGSVTFTSLAEGTYTMTVADTDGVATGVTDHLAFGPVSPVTGADLGTGPRSVTVSSGMAPVDVVLQKLDTALTGSVGTASDGSLTPLTGATVTAVWTSGSRSAAVPVPVTAEAFAGGIASDRPWTVTVAAPDGSGLLDATRSVATGGSGALGRVTLATGVRTVSGELTGPAGRTVTITASANGFAERSVSQTVAIDTGTVAYSLSGLSTDVTWRIDFTVAGTTVSRWVGPGSGDVTLDQAVGADAVGEIMVVVRDMAAAGLRSTSLPVTVTLSETLTVTSTTLNTLAAGSLTRTVTLASGVTMVPVTFSNLVLGSSGTGLAANRFAIAVSATDYDTLTLPSLEPSGQVLAGDLVPSTRDVEVTLTDGSSPLNDGTVTLVDGTTTHSATVSSGSNVYTFSGVRPGAWSIALEGYGRGSITVAIGSGTSSHTVALTELSGSRLEIGRQAVGAASGAVLATQPQVRILGSDERLATLDSSTVVRAAISSGAGGTLRGTTAVTATNGVATFSNLILDGVVGTDYVLTFTASGFAPVASQPVSVTAGAPASAAITVSKSGIDTDGSDSVSITARLSDSGGNAASVSGAVAIVVAGNPVSTSESGGVYSASHTTSTAGQVAVTVTHGGVALAGTAAISTSPAAPTNLVVSAGNGVAYLIWEPPTSDGGSSITDYQVQQSTDGVVWTDVADGVSTSTAATARNLTNGTEYSFRVWASNAIGSGVVSSTVTATPRTASTAPLITSRTLGNGQVELGFVVESQGGDTVTDIEYSLDGGTWTSAATTASPLTITGLTNGTEYGVRLRAVMTVTGAGPSSSTVFATPRTTPGMPSGLTAAIGDGQLTVSFTAGATGGAPITNYEFTLDSGATWTALSPADVLSPVTITGLTNGTATTVSLRAVNAAGASAGSTDTVTATPATYSAAPTITSVTPGDGQITLGFTAGADGGTSITNYQFQVNGGAWQSRSPVSTTSPLTVTGLTNGTPYSIRIRAVSSIGDAIASATVTTTPRTTAAAPTSLSATAGSGSATISFTPGDDGGSTIINYEYSIDAGSTWTAVSPMDSTSPVTISGLTNGTAYSVSLRAATVSGAGTASSPVSVTPIGVVGAPTGLTATASGSTSVDLAWTAPSTTGGSAITDYTVQYRASTSSTWLTWTRTTDPATTPSETVTGLTAGTTYRFRVAAVTAEGSGDFTVTASAVTMTVPGAPVLVSLTTGDMQVIVDWSPPASTGGSPITDYLIEVYDGTSWTTFNDGGSTAPRATVTPLTNGTTYRFRVTAVNAVGSGAVSNELSATPEVVP
jgi:hypothetical protein